MSIKRLLNSLIAALIIVAFFSCGKNGRVISRKKFAYIYADMLVADQWLDRHYSEREIADTSAFYETIFNKYGYTSGDYIVSAAYYLNDPERYAKILERSVTIIDERLRDAVEREKKLRKAEEDYKRRKSYDAGFLDYFSVFNGFVRLDTIDIYKDSVSIYRLRLYYYKSTFLGPKKVMKCVE